MPEPGKPDPRKATLPDPRQPVPEGGEIETRLAEPEDERTERIRRIYQMKSIRETAMLALSYGAGNAIEMKEAALREIYELTEFGRVSVSASAEPSGEGAQRQESSSVQEGARAWLVHAIVECANCSPANYERKREYLEQADSALLAYEKSMRQSSPRSQPVTAKEEAKTVGERRKPRTVSERMMSS